MYTKYFWLVIFNACAGFLVGYFTGWFCDRKAKRQGK